MAHQHVQAVYEDGILRPLEPLELAEHERVSLVVASPPEAKRRESDEYVPLVAELGESDMSWDEIQALLSKIPGSLADDFDRERDERF